MGGKSCRLAVLSLALLLPAAAAEGEEPPPNCEAVRKVFQLRRLGPLGGIPESPRAGKAGLAGQGAPALNLVPPAAMGGRCPGGASPRSNIGASPLVKRENSLLGLWALEHPGTCLKPACAHPVALRMAQSAASRLPAGRGQAQVHPADPGGWDSRRAAPGAAAGALL